MALPGPLIDNKEGNYAPMLLATFQFADGSYLRASTHPLNAGEGGNQYAGNDYLARIDAQDIQQVQARSEQGIDRISDVTLNLYNADQFLLLNYELANGKGFKGAILQLALVLRDIDPATGDYVFSDDSPAPFKFTGICDAPGKAPAGAQFLSIRATTSHNLALVDLPIERVQQRCVNLFPRNAFERLAGATDMSSWQWGCGYNPDQAGTDPEIGGDCRRGNTTTANATDPQRNVIADGAGIYIACNYTKADCVARGMYSQDSSDRATGRFKGIQWSPDNREVQATNYVKGKVTVFRARNEAIYNRPYPLVDGAQWIKNPIIANVLGDGNATRMEVVLCSGDIGHDGVDVVVVNGILIPPNAQVGTDPLERWNFLDSLTDATASVSTHTGGRNGIATADLGYNSLGDPYGGLATIEIVVYSDLAASNSIPSVQVRLKQGTFLVTYTGSGPYTRVLARTTNYAWTLYDKLIWANYSFQELDTASFVAEAAYCDAPVSYIDLNGNAQTHARFICQQAIEEQGKANEIIQAMLRGCNGQLIPNSDTGLLQFFIRKTLADQQPAPVPGSNYDTPVLSVHADNTVADGVGDNGSAYVAYLIDDAVILQDGKGQPQMEGPYALANAQSPNSISFGFQDADNGFQDDSISVVDPDDVARAAGYQLGGAQIPAGYTVRGVSSFDQGIRTCNVILAENFRGNPWLDTRGTYFWQPTTTHRLAHLRVGHICLLRFQSQALAPSVPLQSPPGTGITGILVRVEAIKPASNYQRMTVTLRWHDDRWYTDIYGQRGTPGYSDPRQPLPTRPPLPWRPYAEQPIAGDSMYDPSEWNFGVSQVYGLAGDGSPLAVLPIIGNPTVNTLTTGPARVQPPLMNTEANTANTGGTIKGGQRILMAISVQDVNGKWSALSSFTSVTIPAGTDTNTAVTPTISWGTGTAAWVLFAGIGHNSLSAQASGTATPSTITITALNIATYGPPDALSAGLVIEVKEEIHGGPWGDSCFGTPTSNGDGTGFIHFIGHTVTDHQFQEIDSTHGYDLSVLALPYGNTGTVPIADYHVIDNVAGVYHVRPDPTVAGIQDGTVFKINYCPTVITDTTIGDPNTVNGYLPDGFGTAGNELVGGRVRLTRGTGKGQERNIVGNTNDTITIDQAWHTTPDNTTRYVIEYSAWQDQPTATISNSMMLATPPPQVATVNILNYAKQVILVRALTADQTGKTSLKRWSPYREIYIWGAQGTRIITASQTMIYTDSLIVADCTSNDIVYTMLPFSQLPNMVMTWDRADTSAHTFTVQVDPSTTDTFGSESGPISSFTVDPNQPRTYRING